MILNDSQDESNRAVTMTGISLPTPARDGKMAAAKLGRADHEEAVMRSSLAWALVLLTAACACADNWPGWRGPTGLGVSAEKDLPVKWSATDNIRWKVPLSSPG